MTVFIFVRNKKTLPFILALGVGLETGQVKPAITIAIYRLIAF
jgi:hypothetical protein